jgi:hypothetical protein
MVDVNWQQQQMDCRVHCSVLWQDMSKHSHSFLTVLQVKQLNLVQSTAQSDFAPYSKAQHSTAQYDFPPALL